MSNLKTNIVLDECYQWLNAGALASAACLNIMCGFDQSIGKNWSREFSAAAKVAHSAYELQMKTEETARKACAMFIAAWPQDHKPPAHSNYGESLKLAEAAVLLFNEDPCSSWIETFDTVDAAR